MEVSGKKPQKAIKLCKPCEEGNVSTYAGGFCTQCAEHMCKTCFDTHRQFKLNRGHQWVNVDEVKSSGEQLENYEYCEKHSREEIKFFCRHHDQVGCGDCMILDHKACKVEYIRDLLSAYQGSEELKQLRRHVDMNLNDANGMKTSIKNNRAQIKDVNKKFKRDVNKFKEELISHVTKLANALLKYGDDITAADLKIMDTLEDENESLIKESSNISDTLQSLNKQPYKMFITSVEHKKKLREIEDQLNRIKEKNNIEKYAFKRDGGIEQLLRCQQLGRVEKSKQINRKEEAARPKTSSKTTNVPVLQNSQPLQEIQLLCKNLKVDGDCLSYTPNEHKSVGLFVDNRQIRPGLFLEIQVLETSGKDSIALGVVWNNPNNFNHLPGEARWSYEYRSDGKVFEQGLDCGKKGTSWKIGDRIRCEITYLSRRGAFYACFSHNGKEIDNGLVGIHNWYLAIGMKNTEDRVKVILDS